MTNATPLHIIILKITFWYVTSTIYSIFAKRFVKSDGWPELITLGTLFFASLQSILTNALPPIPLLIKPKYRAVLPPMILCLGSLHAIAVHTTFLSMKFSAVSFTFTIKAAEPLFTAALSSLFEISVVTPQMLLSLVVICSGVVMATYSKFEFAWMGFLSAIVSNMTSSTRSILYKTQLSNSQRSGEEGKQPITAPELYAMMSCTAFVLFSAYFTAAALFLNETPLFGVESTVLDLFLASSLNYATYVTSFSVLGDLAPISHTVSMCAKRLITILCSVLYFRNPLSVVNIIGIVAANIGIGFYSYAKSLAPKIQNSLRTSLLDTQVDKTRLELYYPYLTAVVVAASVSIIAGHYLYA